MEIKSGIKTSEFWLTLISMGVSLAVLSGAIPQGDAPVVLSYGKDILAGIVAVASLYGYVVSSRTALKKASLNQTTVTPSLPDIPQTEEEKTTDTNAIG